MDFMFTENPMAITSCDIYTIPVVVHVIHPNESLGVGANITDDQIESAIEDLTAKFRNEHELSYDVCIEFCLASEIQMVILLMVLIVLMHMMNVLIIYAIKTSAL